MVEMCVVTRAVVRTLMIKPCDSSIAKKKVLLSVEQGKKKNLNSLSKI